VHVLCSSEAVGKLSVSLALMAVVFKLLCDLLNVSLASLCKNLPPKSKWHPKSKVKVNVLNGSGLKFRSVERRQVIVIRSWVALWKNESSTHGVALNSILRTCGFFFFSSSTAGSLGMQTRQNQGSIGKPHSEVQS
jgi:hypothetical protein